MKDLCDCNPFDIYNQFRRRGIFLCFLGPVSQGILEEVGDVLKARLESTDADTTKIQKVFAIFVEQVQNIVNHSSEVVKDADESGESEVRQGLLIVGKDGDEFFVTSGNYIEKVEVAAIVEQLEKLRGMDKEAMKAYYKEMRRTEADTGKGAGIGFIETARKASKPLEYEIRPVDDTLSFFSLHAAIK